VDQSLDITVDQKFVVTWIRYSLTFGPGCLVCYRKLFSPSNQTLCSRLSMAAGLRHAGRLSG